MKKVHPPYFCPRCRRGIPFFLLFWMLLSSKVYLKKSLFCRFFVAEAKKTRSKLKPSDISGNASTHFRFIQMKSNVFHRLIKEFFNHRLIVGAPMYPAPFSNSIFSSPSVIFPKFDIINQS